MSEPLTADAGSYAAEPPRIDHEVISPDVTLDRDSADLERQLALVDRIIALENQLAETHHRYRLSINPELYRLPLPGPPVEPYTRARNAYTQILRVPVVAPIARAAVRAVKKARAARAHG